MFFRPAGRICLTEQVRYTPGRRKCQTGRSARGLFRSWNACSTRVSRMCTCQASSASRSRPVAARQIGAVVRFGDGQALGVNGELYGGGPGGRSPAAPRGFCGGIHQQSDKVRVQANAIIALGRNFQQRRISEFRGFRGGRGARGNGCRRQCTTPVGPSVESLCSVAPSGCLDEALRQPFRSGACARPPPIRGWGFGSEAS